MRANLEASMGPIELADLRPHLSRGNVIVVDGALDLLTVAEAVARDDKAAVADWIERGLLGKPSLETLARWSSTTAPPSLTSVIVQPFVLVREAPPPLRPDAN